MGDLGNSGRGATAGDDDVVLKDQEGSTNPRWGLRPIVSEVVVACAAGAGWTRNRPRVDIRLLMTMEVLEDPMPESLSFSTLMIVAPPDAGVGVGA